MTNLIKTLSNKKIIPAVGQVWHSTDLSDVQNDYMRNKFKESLFTEDGYSSALHS